MSKVEICKLFSLLLIFDFPVLLILFSSALIGEQRLLLFLRESVLDQPHPTGD